MNAGPFNCEEVGVIKQNLLSRKVVGLTRIWRFLSFTFSKKKCIALKEMNRESLHILQMRRVVFGMSFAI